MECVNRCKPMEVNRQIMRDGESLPGTSFVPYLTKHSHADINYLHDLKGLPLNRKTRFCPHPVDRLYTDAVFLPKNIPSPW